MKTYKLYDVKIMETKKDGVWLLKKDWVSSKAIEEGHYDVFGEEVYNGRTFNQGTIFLDDISNIEEFKNFGTYDVEISVDEESGDGKKSPKKNIVSAVLTTTKKQIMKVYVGDLMKTRETNKDMLFLNVRIGVEELDNAKNKSEIIESFESKGFMFKEEPYNDNYTFSAVIFPQARDIPMFTSLAKKNLHLGFMLKSQPGKNQIIRVLRPTFENKDLKINGTITDIQEDGIIVTMYTTYDLLKNEDNMDVIHFCSIEREHLDEKTPEGNDLKLTYKITVDETFDKEVGDDIEVVLNEENTIKLLTPKILYVGSENEEVKEVSKQVDDEQDEEVSDLPF